MNSNHVTFVSDDDKRNQAPISNRNENPLENHKGGVNIINKEYVLNDLEALKKKLNNEHRKPEIQMSKEASNGSCATVGMKTSLFEYSKAVMTNILLKDARILEVRAVQKAVAKTNYNGNVDVESSLPLTLLTAIFLSTLQSFK